MAIFDFITGIKDKLPKYGNIENELVPLQIDTGVTPQQPLTNRLGLGNRLYDAIFGKMVDNSSVDNVSLDDNTLSATIRNPQRQGGILNDLREGFRENAKNGFEPQNLMGNGGSLARKIGEGFGTALRFAESPLGRGLLVGGAIGALGGTPAEMAAFGLGTTALNQGNRTADRLYRAGLEEQGYDTSGLNGYINKDLYNNISLNNYRNSRINQQLQIAQMKDNTSRAKMITDWLQRGMISPQEASSLISMYGITDADFQKSNATRMTDIREEKAPYEIENLEARTENIKNPAPKKVIHVSEGKGGKKDSTEQNTDLAEYQEILQGGDEKKIQYARNTYIRRYGKDPDKQIRM